MEWHWETQKKIWENRVGKEQVVQRNGTSWHKLEYVEQVEQEQGGHQIDVEQVEQGQGVCPAKPLHLWFLVQLSTRLCTFSRRNVWNLIFESWIDEMDMLISSIFSGDVYQSKPWWSDRKCWLGPARGSAKRCMLRKILSFCILKDDKKPALHCAGNSMGGDLRTWWGEALNEVQAALWKLILGRMHHRGTCRVLAPRTHSILQSAFSESIELCVRHRSVNYAAGAIGMRCNFISMILCAILHYCQTTRSWDDVYHPPFSICDLHRQIYWSTLCAWYVQHSQQFLTLIQYMCNKKVDVPKSWLHWLQ